eukprot:1898794-Pyramimonas_sp.AAC.1
MLGAKIPDPRPEEAGSSPLDGGQSARRRRGVVDRLSPTLGPRASDRKPEIFESKLGDPRIWDPRRSETHGAKISDPRSEDGGSSLPDG